MLEFIILLVAGIGAGIVTGLVGASAVMVAAPLLIVILDYPAYLAIGIALLTDVFASLFATIIYKRNGRIKIKSSLILLVAALIAALIGSFLSVNVPSDNLGIATGLGIALAGASIMVKKKTDHPKIKKASFFRKHKNLSLILVGLLIGGISGTFGAGGGVMILLFLVLILNYKTHEAIGTSVFLMIFIALFGGIGHYVNLQFPVYLLLISGTGAILGSSVSARIANKLKEKTLNKVVGNIIVLLGILLVLKNIIYIFN